MTDIAYGFMPTMLTHRYRPSATVLVAFLLAAVVLAFGPAARAQEAPTAPPPNRCAADEFRQFDFWIGDWRVAQRDGSVAGSNRIERILNGCVLQENWSGGGGSLGKSFNHWDLREKKWRQLWLDGNGGRLDLAGGLDDEGRMVMRGETPGAGGGRLLHEISWTPKPDGSVEQHWRTSADGGETWSETFFGIYRHSDPPPQ